MDNIHIPRAEDILKRRRGKVDSEKLLDIVTRLENEFSIIAFLTDGEVRKLGGLGYELDRLYEVDGNGNWCYNIYIEEER